MQKIRHGLHTPTVPTRCRLPDTGADIEDLAFASLSVSPITSSAVDPPCLDPQSTCCQEQGGAAQVFRRSPQLVGG